jgi:hypothetical protein
MNFRHVILTVFVLCGAFSAAAQTLVTVQSWHMVLKPVLYTRVPSLLSK